VEATTWKSDCVMKSWETISAFELMETRRKCKEVSKTFEDAG